MTYEEFLESKRRTPKPSGFEIAADAINPQLFDFQRDIVRWALRLGKAAIFADCGLGKTPMQLEWAQHVREHTGRDILILAPLAVARQTIHEGEKFGVAVSYSRDGAKRKPGITITNYEMLEHFNPSDFGGIVLDESSILKSFTSKTRNAIIEGFGDVPFRLACTATPSPNDFMELGNHAEFLSSMTRTEMLSMFFVHDGGETSKWRIKGHAEKDFWSWVCSWAVMLRRPGELGYSNEGFDLPPFEIREEILAADTPPEGFLFAIPVETLSEQRSARKASRDQRIKAAVEIVNAHPDEPLLIWCEMNEEGDILEKMIPGAVQVAGADSIEDKEDRLLGFSEGRYRVLVTKPSIAGHGLNWQHCARMVFVGLSHSYEQFYQATRRCWRFGQKRPVTAHLISTDVEQAILLNIKRKESEALKMAEAMAAEMKDRNAEALHGVKKTKAPRKITRETGDGWEMRLGDCVEECGGIEDKSIDYSIFSPPFASLYTYSDSERDMGNTKTHSEFFEHFRFLVRELHRITKPGRNLSFHCMNLPTSKERDGVIGITDFRGDLIRIFSEAGWIYHSEVVIWKDPVTAMQRTKALGLLYKQLRKDSAMSRQGIPDYLVTMRKPGENPNPVTKTHESFPVGLWQRYASPVWMDINPSKTLQRKSAREEKDERHICPLQLEVSERAIMLWSNPGDLVLSPFAGIGSEGHEALRLGRRFLGIELKESYYKQACLNLAHASKLAANGTIFDDVESAEECDEPIEANG